MKDTQIVMLYNKVRCWAFHKKEQLINDVFWLRFDTKTVCLCVLLLCACVYISQNTLNWKGPIMIIWSHSLNMLYVYLNYSDD